MIDLQNRPPRTLPTMAVADCTIVIPTYNECENITAITSQVLSHPRFRVLIVDDNSPDGTAAIVSAMARADSRIGLLSRPGKLGLGPAYIAGLDVYKRQFLF